LIGLSLPLVFLLQTFELSELFVPIRLEGIGHEAMIRIAPQEPPPLEFYFIAHAFQLLLTQPVGFLDATADLVLDSQGRPGSQSAPRHATALH